MAGQAFPRSMARILALGKTARVAWVDAYADESYWFELDDALHQTALVCIDRREDSPTRYRLFEGARHPEKPGATLIELGSLEEGIVVSAISWWLDSDEARKGVRPEAREKIQEALLRFGEPNE